MKLKLRHVNACLLVAVLAVNLYIIVLPVAPAVMFWLHNRGGSLAISLSHQIQLRDNFVTPKDNRLIIPRILLNEPLQESGSILNSGVWRRTNTSSPDKGGNTVIAGHRFTYTNPNGSFYNLDKVRLGDEMGVFWQGKKYIYRVSAIGVVRPNELQIEAPTKQPQLTIYTCTPLYLPKDRLVITAELKDHS